MVAWKIVEMQLHDLSQTSSENLWPLQITKFSRQFVPDLASCSLSEATVNVFNMTVVCQMTRTVSLFSLKNSKNPIKKLDKLTISIFF